MRKSWVFGLPIVVAILMIINAGCRHSDAVIPAVNTTGGQNDTTSTPNPPNNPVQPDTGICFERDILPIFISNCAKSGCHDAQARSEGYQFTDYNSIVAKKFFPGNANATELYRKITESDHDEVMPPPPSPRLTDNQVYLVRRWINEGAKNTTGCNTGCDSNNFSYTTAIRPLADQYCKGCHNASLASGGVTLDTYAGIKAVALNGRLLGAVKHMPGYKPMPQGGNKLSDCQLRQVEKWVAAGAPES